MKEEYNPSVVKEIYTIAYRFPKRYFVATCFRLHDLANVKGCP